jgi:hypothetical protein
MLWDLAHRRRGDAVSTRLEVDAHTSGVAIDDVRSEIPADHVLLYIRRLG